MGPMNPNIAEIWEANVSCPGGCGHRMLAHIERDKRMRVQAVNVAGRIEEQQGGVAVNFVSIQRGPNGAWSRVFCNTCGKTANIQWRKKISG